MSVYYKPKVSPIQGVSTEIIKVMEKSPYLYLKLTAYADADLNRLSQLAHSAGFKRDDDAAGRVRFRKRLSHV